MLAVIFWICAAADRLHAPRLPARRCGRSSPCAASRRCSPGTWEEPPRVSLIVAAYDEEEVIAAKVANALALDYPRERLELIVASDGSADATVERARAAGADLVLELPRGGKIAAQNAAAERASGEILAFSDANSVWAPDALRHLVEPFADPAVGYVCGQVRFLDPDGDNLEGAYWRYEMAVREMESALAGVTAGNGAIYAVRARRLHPARRPRAATTSPSPSRSPSAACARSTSPGPRAEEKMVPTLEGEFARKRRMMVGLWDIVVGEGMLLPARLPAALRLRARLAPAAALPDPVPAPDRLRRQPRPARPGLGLRRRPRRSSSPSSPPPLLGGRCRSAPLPDRPLLRADHRLDRRRPLGPLPPRRRRAPGRRPRAPGDAAPGEPCRESSTSSIAVAGPGSSSRRSC